MNAIVVRPVETVVIATRRTSPVIHFAVESVKMSTLGVSDGLNATILNQKVAQSPRGIDNH